MLMNPVGLQLRLQSDFVLPALGSDFLDFLSRQSQPLKKFLVSLGMAVFKHSVPLLHLCVIQPQLPEHLDPVFYRYLWHFKLLLTGLSHITAMMMRTVRYEPMVGSRFF
jgi:hypothetical protein